MQGFSVKGKVLRRELFTEGARKVLRRQEHVLLQSTTPFAYTLGHQEAAQFGATKWGLSDASASDDSPPCPSFFLWGGGGKSLLLPLRGIPCLFYFFFPFFQGFRGSVGAKTPCLWVVVPACFLKNKERKKKTTGQWF